MEFAKVSLFDGAEPNRTVGVRADGSLQADVTGSAVESTIAPAVSDVETTRDTLGTTSETIAAADDDRAQIVLQNLDTDGVIHALLGPGSATNDDLMIPPGGSFSFPVGMVYRGAIQAIATEADTPYVLIVYRRSE